MRNFRCPWETLGVIYCSCNVPPKQRHWVSCAGINQHLPAPQGQLRSQNGFQSWSWLICSKHFVKFAFLHRFHNFASFRISTFQYWASLYWANIDGSTDIHQFVAETSKWSHFEANFKENTILWQLEPNFALQSHCIQKMPRLEQAQFRALSLLGPVLSNGEG